MKKEISITDVLALSLTERIQLVEDIWDSIAYVPESVELPDWQRKELDRRLEAYRDNPEAGSPWEQVRARIEKTSRSERSEGLS